MAPHYVGINSDTYVAARAGSGPAGGAHDLCPRYLNPTNIMCKSLWIWLWVRACVLYSLTVTVGGFEYVCVAGLLG